MIKRRPPEVREVFNQQHVVTNNLAEFERVPGLLLENWLMPAGGQSRETQLT